MGVGFAIASVFLTAASNQQARKAAKVGRERNRVQRAVQESDAIRERRKVSRRARLVRARIEQNAENIGAQESSGALAGVGSARSKEASANSFLSGRQFATNSVSNLNQLQSDISNRANTYAKASQLFSQIGSSNFFKSSKQLDESALNGEV